MWTFGGQGAVPGLAHAVTTREGGVSEGAFASLNLGRSTPDRLEAVLENRRRAARALGFESFVGPRQVHGAAVVEVTPQPHTGCRKFVDRFGLDAMKFVNSPVGRELNLRGINAKVVQAGTFTP